MWSQTYSKISFHRKTRPIQRHSIWIKDFRTHWSIWSVSVPYRRELTMATNITCTNVISAHQTTIFIQNTNTPFRISESHASNQRSPKLLAFSVDHNCRARTYVSLISTKSSWMVGGSTNSAFDRRKLCTSSSSSPSITPNAIPPLAHCVYLHKLFILIRILKLTIFQNITHFSTRRRNASACVDGTST